MRRHFKPTTPLLGATLLAALLGGCTSTQAPTQASAAAPSAAAPTAPKPATPTTERANAAVRQTLAAFDPRDFEDATRGKLAELSDPLVKAADGRVVYNTKSFDFAAQDQERASSLRTEFME